MTKNFNSKAHLSKVFVLIQKHLESVYGHIRLGCIKTADVTHGTSACSSIVCGGGGEEAVGRRNAHAAELPADSMNETPCCSVLFLRCISAYGPRSARTFQCCNKLADDAI
jgi:hypothetical protein